MARLLPFLGAGPGSFPAGSPAVSARMSSHFLFFYACSLDVVLCEANLLLRVLGCMLVAMRVLSCGYGATEPRSDVGMALWKPQY
eukprot:2088642-Rhodomonas_salina.4